MGIDAFNTTVGHAIVVNPKTTKETVVTFTSSANDRTGAVRQFAFSLTKKSRAAKPPGEVFSSHLDQDQKEYCMLSCISRGGLTVLVICPNVDGAVMPTNDG